MTEAPTESNPIYQYFEEGEYTVKLEISTTIGYDIVTLNS